MTEPGASVEYNIFLTWSGDRSRAVAGALHVWLRRVIQACRPWMSARNISSGERWRGEVAHHLATIKLGVLCLTPENIAAPWINFEAGALSQAVGRTSRVIPYCYDLKPTGFGDPLGDFQGVEATRAGSLTLVKSLNEVMAQPLDDGDLLATFDRFWPDLEQGLAAIPPRSETPERRTSDDILDEILRRVRGLEHVLQATDDLLPLPEGMIRTGQFVGPMERMFGRAASREWHLNTLPRLDVRVGSDDLPKDDGDKK